MKPHRHGFRRQIAQLLVVALLIGSLPMAASPIIGEPASTPAFTLDVCHPLPVLAIGASCTLALFTAYSFSIAIEDRGPAEVSDLTRIDRAGEAPDPPPPKTPA